MKVPYAGGLAMFLTQAPEQFFKFNLMHLGRVTHEGEEHGKTDTFGQTLLLERESAEELPGHLLEHMNVRAFYDGRDQALGVAVLKRMRPRDEAEHSLAAKMRPLNLDARKIDKEDDHEMDAPMRPLRG